jgi:hypothetical protein
VKSKDFNALPSAKVRFVEPLYALPVQKLPQGLEWLYELNLMVTDALRGEIQPG